MAKAFIFPGQGAQYPGMGKDLYAALPEAKELFDKANDILGFNISKVMFEGTDNDLKRTNVTQPAIFLHSVILAKMLRYLPAEVLETKGITAISPDMVAGHSLGEFSALAAAGAMSFEDGLNLVKIRAEQMQLCCEKVPGTMAAVIGLPDEVVEQLCSDCEGVVVAANYNCPGQVVISGDKDAIAQACDKAKAAGARRALQLSVGGAFHSPLMEPAREELAKAIAATAISAPSCPIYQNVSAKAETDPDIIKANLLTQLTSPVRWTGSVQSMIADGADSFLEIGPGAVLQGLVKRIASSNEIVIKGISTI